MVAESNHLIIGFAALSPYKERAAYRTTVENSVYVDPDERGSGVADALLAELLAVAQSSGFHAVVARIGGGNEASIRLHEKHGFNLVGTEREIGRKFGRWQDVVVMQTLLESGAPGH